MDFMLIAKIAAVVVAVIVGIATPLIIKKKDTPIEQAAERVLKDVTGVDVDFSPEDKKEI